MKAALLLSSVLALAGLCSAVPSSSYSKPIPPSPSKPAPKCKKPLIRKEWRNLSKRERKAYTSAVLCLNHKKPIAHKTVPAALSRYDDFVGVHNNQTDEIHFVGHFLPWHRYFGATYEKALREECGYKGAQPYWDWTIDVASGKNFSDWEVFDSEYGIGGDGVYAPYPPEMGFEIPGRTGGGCVKAGPFTYPNFRLALGPTRDTSIRNIQCLTRDFLDILAYINLNTDAVSEVANQTTYGMMARRMEAEQNFDRTNIHGGGHFAVGGFIGTFGKDPYNSPGDPVFFLHHATLDYIWWKWQTQNPKRMKDISGPIVPFDYENVKAGNVTLDFEIHLNEVAPRVKVADLMDTTGGVLCYEYE